ncbi:MAG TPA: hypothetical protein VFG74_11065, partial [Miltoncostaeaceae bacterium]|nr:hypothetical protein [Miltoncostaeaceae bacterium]
MTTSPDPAPTNGADAPRALIVGVPAETYDGERRVAVTPAVVPALVKLGGEVVVESGAGERAGFTDADYEAKGARIGSRDDAWSASVVTQVRVLGGD